MDKMHWEYVSYVVKQDQKKKRVNPLNEERNGDKKDQKKREPKKKINKKFQHLYELQTQENNKPENQLLHKKEKRALNFPHIAKKSELIKRNQIFDQAISIKTI